MNRPMSPVPTTIPSADVVAVASTFFDWKVAWKAMTSGLMNPTKTWKLSQSRMSHSPVSARVRLRTG